MAIRSPAIRRTSITASSAAIQICSPEKADSLTAGVVIQPRFIPGLALTADYFNIKVKNVIGAEAYGNVFTQCFAGDAAECALFTAISSDRFGSRQRICDA